MSAQPGLDIETIEAAIVSFVENVTELQCIWTDEAGGGQPTLPYAAVTWSAPPSKLGYDEHTNDENDVNTATKEIQRQRSGPRVATLSMHVFSNTANPATRASAMHYASLLEGALDTDEGRAQLGAAGIGVGAISPLRNLPSPRDGTSARVQHVQFEVDVNLAYNAVVSEATPYVETVVTGGTISGVDRGSMTIPET